VHVEIERIAIDAGGFAGEHAKKWSRHASKEINDRELHIHGWSLLFSLMWSV